jgi:hypothetical protein
MLSTGEDVGELSLRGTAGWKAGWWAILDKKQATCK